MEFTLNPNNLYVGDYAQEAHGFPTGPPGLHGDRGDRAVEQFPFDRFEPANRGYFQ